MIRNALRIAALIAGIVLIVGPLWWLIDLNYSTPLASIPIKYRPTQFIRFSQFFGQFFAIYGSVLLGMAVHWMRAKRSGQPSSSSQVFKAGMLGMLAAIIVVCGGGILYDIVKYNAAGGLWGLVVYLWAMWSALVSAGIALLFYAWRGQAAPPSMGPGTGPWSSPPKLHEKLPPLSD